MTKTNGATWHMPGSEGTGRYVVIAMTTRGRIGVRVLSGEVDKITHIRSVRVRVEPRPEAVQKMVDVLPAKNWKQPGEDGQQRFSRVVDSATRNSARVKRILAHGLKALGVNDGLATQVNPEAPTWAKRLVERVQQGT